MLLLSLAACTDYTIQAPPEVPLTLSITSPTYGQFLGDGPIAVSGVVTPSSAFVQVNGATVLPDEAGNFVAELPFDDRAVVVDVIAIAQDQQLRKLVPVFDDADPRASDPGAIGGLLSPTGLDALEPIVVERVDGLGLIDQLFTAIPAIDNDYLSLTPVSLTTTGTTADLAPGFDSIELTVTLHDVTLLTEVTVAGAYTFDLGVALGELTFGAFANPWVDADGMLGLTLSDAVVEMGDVGLSVADFDIPDWLADLLLDPVASLVADLVGGLGDLLLDQIGELPLGGPFAFAFDLLDTSLAARLVEVDASTNGVSLGATVGYGVDAAEAMPEVATLAATTPAGLAYQLGASIHEGMFNVLLDETLAGFLDIDLVLEGEYGELLGSGFAALDGGNEMPEESNGFCLGLHVGDARVIRMVAGTGAPLARAYLPDVQVNIDTIQGTDCVDWMDASLFATIDLSLDGTAIAADFNVQHVALLEYGAEDYDRAAVEGQLGAVIEGLAGLLAGDLSFDLGGAIDLGGLSLAPTIVSVEPLDDEGLFGVYLNVF